MKTCRHLLLGTIASTALALAGAASAQTMSTQPDVNAGQTDGSVTAQSTTTGTSTSAWGDSGYSSGMDENRYSIVPYTRNGYVGLNLGVSDYRTDCGSFGNCSNPDISGKIYTGGMFNQNFGLELAYLHMGRAERGGGNTHAHGVNLSLVGNLPLYRDSVGLFAKAGMTYGHTETSADAGSGVETGDENGFGPSFGGGLSISMTRAWSAVLEWERHRFEFAGGNREWVDQATLGLKYRF